MLCSRGGVENIRLKCSQKKARSSKIFFRRSQKKGLEKIFSGNLYLKKTKKGVHKFTARFLAFSNKISTVSNKISNKNGAVLEPRTGQFSIT